MKGSLKIKFDLGWVFSATFAVCLIIFLVARASVSFEIQKHVVDACTFLADDTYQVYDIHFPDKQKPDYNNLINTCEVDYKKSFLTVFMDTDAWEFKEAYPKLFFVYSDSKSINKKEKELLKN